MANSSTSNHLSALTFTSHSLVGNIGAPLSSPVQKDEDEEDGLFDMESHSMPDTIETQQASDDPLVTGIVAASRESMSHHPQNAYLQCGPSQGAKSGYCTSRCNGYAAESHMGCTSGN